MSFLSRVGPYVIVAFAAASGGFALHLLVSPLARWDVRRALVKALPALARRFETDVAFQRACFNYSAVSAEHRCELMAMAAALEAYEQQVRDGERVAALPTHQGRRYTDGLAEAERHARQSGGHREQSD